MRVRGDTDRLSLARKNLADKRTRRAAPAGGFGRLGPADVGTHGAVLLLAAALRRVRKEQRVVVGGRDLDAAGKGVVEGLCYLALRIRGRLEAYNRRMAKSRYRDLWTLSRAAYVLDGLLYHESEIDPEEHYTDTHGYTELNFAAFAMFGKRFCPGVGGAHRRPLGAA